MSLRYPVTIQRRAPGAWVAGRWVAGDDGPTETIQATVQPATLSDYDELQPLPEGRRIERMVRVYTASILTIAANDNTASGDLLLWPEGLGAEPYEFVWCSPWQSHVIPHYRYLAAKMEAPRT